MIERKRMRLLVGLALCFCFITGCSDKGNQVIDTTNRTPPPDAKELQDYNAAMEAAAKQPPAP
jgi:hypothetical protein